MNRSLEVCQVRDYHVNSTHLRGQLNIYGWRYELQHENDDRLRNYLTFGIHYGFLIVDPGADIEAYECTNYPSVMQGEAFMFVDKLIRDELIAHKFVVAQEKPHCIHAVGAVPKKNSKKWRPITDCRRPLGSSINNFMSTTYKEFCYTSVDRVINMIERGYYMASIDIAAAYRSIPIHPDNWRYQGIRWPINGHPTYLYDTHLCFGSKCAPYIFTQVSNFVLRCLQRRGHHLCTVYLDDFLLLGRTREECQDAQSTLIEILRSLGFYIAWDKCVMPSQQLTYLGVSFDSWNMTVSLPTEKMNRLHQASLGFISFFLTKSRATKRQIQQLCGILSHCAKIVKGGRTFSHRVIQLLKNWQIDRKRNRLGTQFKYDLYWWRDFAANFNGKNLMIRHYYGEGPSFYTDSCLAGYGLWCQDDWQAGYFNVNITPSLSSLEPTHGHWSNVHIEDSDSSANINVLELIPVWLCIKRNAYKWRNLHIICFTDNQSVLHMVNKGCSSNEQCMTLLRDMFWICATSNFHVTAKYISSKDNHLADWLSRIFFTNDLCLIGEFSLCCSPNQPPCGYG